MLPSPNHPLIFSSADVSAKLGAPQEYVAVKRKIENVDQVVLAIVAKTLYSHKQTCPDETDLVVQDLLEEYQEDVYVDESDDDLDAEEMDKDEELQDLIDFVFGPETEDED